MTGEIRGWLLVTQERDAPAFRTPEPRWRLASLNIFGSKREAMAFARKHGCPEPYRAVRVGSSP